MRAARGMEPTEGSQREVWNPIGSGIPQLPLVENYAAVGTVQYCIWAVYRFIITVSTVVHIYNQEKYFTIFFIHNSLEIVTLGPRWASLL